MGTNAVRRDATAETVSANVKDLRKARNLGLRSLAKKLEDVGRPLSHSAVDQIEKGTRRVDVDDLVALALALDVQPSVLLMPRLGDPVEVVAVTEKVGMSANQLWRWLTAAPDSLAHMAEWPVWEQTQWIGDTDGDS
jgi:transcriptional regulator with XRE-family HTH domain